MPAHPSSAPQEEGSPRPPCPVPDIQVSPTSAGKTLPNTSPAPQDPLHSVEKAPPVGSHGQAALGLVCLPV